ncbi:MAG: site-2 protease family protein [Methanosarcina flavescens]|jgi:membrane-associated protease RseP (regulator of RpoE activity)|uniref:Site-2 protease family protein n=1 Tax=Methanosarcina flavescens TaxID=1715806 RepID=A0A660HSX6_9EURY|nr:site-2 protease family protein [Methanosarcina flavescens]AYK15398.1 site-2 protease family protein [Methanosarcina flavescens]NLK33781.1 site-2 protease family protein [Methanosarcina flavescens]
MNRENHKKDRGKFNAEETVSRLYPFIVRVFDVYEIQNSGETLYFYGTPRVDAETLTGELWEPLQHFGFECVLKYELGEYILLVSPEKKAKEKIWLNLVLFITTFFTTMVCGAWMFGVNLEEEPFQLFQGLSFTLAIMAVLGSHEMAHYAMARYHGMKASLPYFIPFPTFIGTMGAVIRYKGPVPSRKALFDVGIAGPLAGLLMSVAVTIIGLNLEMPAVKPLPDSMMFDLGLPPLFVFIQTLVGATGQNLHPVAFAGWVGMFVTLLNLLPAGQLDGGHILRAMMGKKAEKISFLMPRILFLTGIYVIYWLKEDGAIWIFWALFLWVFAAAGHPSPLHDKVELDKKRILLGIITFILGFLCFTLIPFKPIS